MRRGWDRVLTADRNGLLMRARLACLIRSLWTEIKWQWAALFLVLLLAPGCALHGGPRHTATVSIVSTHAVLSAIDDTEMQIVCGRPGAPQAPLCVPISQHRVISAYLKQAYDLEVAIGRVVLALPDGQMLPPDVMALTVQVGALINKVIEMLPQGKTKAALMQRIGPEVAR